MAGEAEMVAVAHQRDRDAEPARRIADRLRGDGRHVMADAVAAIDDEQGVLRADLRPRRATPPDGCARCKGAGGAARASPRRAGAPSVTASAMASAASGEARRRRADP